MNRCILITRATTKLPYRPLLNVVGDQVTQLCLLLRVPLALALSFSQEEVPVLVPAVFWMPAQGRSNLLPLIAPLSVQLQQRLSVLCRPFALPRPFHDESGVDTTQ